MNERDKQRQGAPAAMQTRWDRIAGSTQTLVRSHLEIARILQPIVVKRIPLTAYFPTTDRFFMSYLRRIDAMAGFLVIDYGGDKAANTELLATHSVHFSCCSDTGADIEFMGAALKEILDDAVPALRCAFPDLLLMQQRRAQRRISTLPHVPLRCIADAQGVIPFEAEIVDISSGGLGAMVYDAQINLSAGTVLRGCRIVHPSGAAAEVDIEVRFAAATTLQDGRSAYRAGCRFISPPAELEDLLRLFVVDLEHSGDPPAD